MFKPLQTTICLLVLVSVMTISSEQLSAQRPGINQDESKVPQYRLPDLLGRDDGSIVWTSNEWESKRRPEVLQLFADHVYGNFPDQKLAVEFSGGPQWEVYDGRAVRQEITIRFGSENQVTATMLLTIPKSETPVPCFIGYNFNGNHTTTDDPKVSITTSWVRDKKQLGAKKNRASAKGRGTSSSRWPMKEITENGYAVATIYYGDVDPDFDDGFQNGIHPLFYAEGQTKPGRKQWGSIGAWAWALSRALDYLETDKAIDGKRVAVIGHSRLGKTSLWAGATDQRFWITISNDSGCGGAALHRRKFGETVKVINTNFPHWFCDQFVEYNDKESEIPVDQHMLMALMAPRPVYVASASGDLWADPKGEYLSLANSNAVFALYGEGGWPSEKMPAADQPAHFGVRGYHLRTGKHDITEYDWRQYIKFANGHLKNAIR